MASNPFESSRWGQARRFHQLEARIQELEAQLAVAAPPPGVKIALMMSFHGWQHEEILKQWIQMFWPLWGGGPFFEMRSLYVVEARNRITAGALNYPEAAWDVLLSLDSDHFPNPFMVQRIREHTDAAGHFRYPVLGGPYFGRGYPFDVQAWVEDARVDGLLPIEPATLMGWLNEERGVHRVDGCGTGTMVIRRDVLQRLQHLRGAGLVWHTEKVPPQLVRHISDQERRRGKDGSFITGAEWSEDMQFCFDVRELLGEPVHLDTDPRMETGHEATMIVDHRYWMAAHFVPSSVQLDPQSLREQGLELRQMPQAASGNLDRDTEGGRLAEPDAERLNAALERRKRRAERRLG